MLRMKKVFSAGAGLFLTAALLLGPAAVPAGAAIVDEDKEAEKARLKGTILGDNILDYPWDYVKEPGGFRESPPGFRATPLNYREKPLQYQVVPQNYREKILTDIGLPRGYAPNPPNFIEKDNHPLVNLDPQNQMSNDTHPLKNERADFRISIEDNPLTNTTIAKSLEDVDKENA